MDQSQAYIQAEMAEAGEMGYKDMKIRIPF